MDVITWLPKDKGLGYNVILCNVTNNSNQINPQQISSVQLIFFFFFESDKNKQQKQTCNVQFLSMIFKLSFKHLGPYY
jgi:hypothetical protein